METEEKRLNDGQKQILLSVAKETIKARLNDKSIPEFGFEDEIFQEKRGAFVTLHKSGNLRGCIGYIQGLKPMLQTIEKMAISASFKDPRFPALQKEEFSKLNIEISMLTPLTEVNDVKEIEVGRDGLIIKQGFRQGLLLPQVAVENNWERVEFLQNTCRKAGLPVQAWRDSATEIKKFSAQVFAADVAEILDTDEARNRFSSHMRE